MQKGQSACGVFCLFYINNRRQKQAAMHIPKSALNPWSSRNGNSLVVIAAEHDTWANYSVWEAELISPDAASYWHSYNPSGTWARILLIRHFSLLAASSKISEYYAVLYFLVLLSVQKKKRKKGKKKSKNMFIQRRKQWKRALKKPQKTLNTDLQLFCKRGGGCPYPQCYKPNYNIWNVNLSSMDTLLPPAKWKLFKKSVYHYDNLNSKSSLLPKNARS